MVKFLNERGFRRIVKAIKNALSLKADKTELPLVVNFDADKNTCDTSITDIIAAHNAGRVVEMKFVFMVLPLVAAYEGYVAFSIKMSATSIVNIEGTVENGSDVWSQGADTLTFDSTPTAGSNNPVTSGGVKTALDEKQDTLVSGTNIKTINNTSLLGDGNISIEPNEIASITTTESSTSGGNNTVTINTTDGTSKAFNVKNGKDGKDGQDGADGVSLGEIALVQTTGDSEESVMSQKAITDAINYNVNIEHGTGFTLNSNAGYRYLKLTPKAVSLLNASDKMTFVFSTRSTGNNMEYRYFSFGNGNPDSNGPDGTNGVYLGWSYIRNLSANGVDYSLNKPNSNMAPTPDVWIVTWDRINGVVKFYNRTTLVNTLTSDSYKKTQFVNSSGVLTILGGDNNTRIYDIRLFDFDISHLFNNSDVKLEIDYLDGTGILPSQFLSNYTVANSDSSFNTEVNSFQGGGYSATCTYTLDGDNYHIVVKDGVSTSQACGGKPYHLGRANRAQLEKLEFEVVSGVIRTSIDPNNASTVHYYHIYDSNNDEISDYSNIGVGSYTLIRTSSTTGARLDFYKVSGNVEVIMNRNMQYKPISCIFHWSGDTMYNKKFYDDQTNEFITLYTTRSCSTPYTGHTMVKTPQRVILSSTANMLPHYSGEMAITGGKVYIGMPDYTWKQINNS